jgi:hypothetical protein
MSDTARDFSQIEPVSTKGLEDLFVEDLTRTDADADKSDRLDRPDRDPDADIYWTPQMAAAHFGVTERTIRRRLKEGLLRGWKVSGTNGPEWRIDPVANPDADADKSDGSDRLDMDADAEVVKKPQTQVDLLLDYLREKDQLLEQKEKDLQAASATIGYMQRQIEDQGKQLQLLTDSQNKPGWWQRLSNWLTGQQ